MQKNKIKQSEIKNFLSLQENKKAFTLVELIVVIVILAILGTISFIAMQGYTKYSRNAVRVGDISAISKAITIKMAEGSRCPEPENKVEITASGTTIMYQGTFTEDMGSKVGVNGEIKDPLTQKYYTYTTDTKLKKHEIIAILEDSIVINNTSVLSQEVYADNETEIVTKGDKLGFIFTTDNIPLQETGTTSIDIINTNTEYKAYLDNSETITGTGNVLAYLNPKHSCKRILELGNSRSGINADGVYKIDPAGTGEFDVYCDMTTDGGGWTKITDDDIVDNNRISLENINYSCYELETDVLGNKVIFFKGICSLTSGSYPVSMTTITLPFNFSESKGNLTAYQYGGTNPPELYRDFEWGSWQTSCSLCRYGMFYLGSDTDGRNKLVSDLGPGQFSIGTNRYREWEKIDNERLTNKFRIQIGENNPNRGETVYLDDMIIWVR